MKINELTAGILIGGKSSRMGENKAFLKINDTTFLENALKTCRGFSETLVSVDDIKKYKKYPYHFVEDEIKEYGPLEGIYQVLRAASNKYSFILAVDMPLLTEEFLERVSEEFNADKDAMVLKDGDKIHPLCGIYSKRLTHEMKKMRNQGERKIRRLYDRIDIKFLNIKDIGFPEELLSNINTPKEYGLLYSLAQI